MARATRARARPLARRLRRPVAGSYLVTRLAAPLVAGLPRWPRLLALGVLAVVVGLVAERLLRRVLPLAALLRMTMLFPDHAPSRFKLARSVGNTRVLEERARTHPGETAGEAATRILGLLTALSAHDRRTRGHSERVRVFTDVLAAELHLPAGGARPAALGGAAARPRQGRVPTTMLNKPAALEADEWAMIRRHPDAGRRPRGPVAGMAGRVGRRHLPAPRALRRPGLSPRPGRARDRAGGADRRRRRRLRGHDRRTQLQAADVGRRRAPRARRRRGDAARPGLRTGVPGRQPAPGAVGRRAAGAAGQPARSCAELPRPAGSSSRRRRGRRTGGHRGSRGDHRGRRHGRAGSVAGHRRRPTARASLVAWAVDPCRRGSVGHRKADSVDVWSTIHQGRDHAVDRPDLTRHGLDPAAVGRPPLDALDGGRVGGASASAAAPSKHTGISSFEHALVRRTVDVGLRCGDAVPNRQPRHRPRRRPRARGSSGSGKQKPATPTIVSVSVPLGSPGDRDVPDDRPRGDLLLPRGRQPLGGVHQSHDHQRPLERQAPHRGPHDQRGGQDVRRRAARTSRSDAAASGQAYGSRPVMASRRISRGASSGTGTAGGKTP